MRALAGGSELSGIFSESKNKPGLKSVLQLPEANPTACPRPCSRKVNRQPVSL